MPGWTGDLRPADSDRLVAALGVLGGLLGAAGPAEPTGHPLTDAVLTGVGVLVLVVVGSRAPWWIVGVTSGVALAIAVDPVLIAVAACGLAAVLVAGSRPQPPPWLLAASLGVSGNVLARAELGGPHGTSAAIALAVGALVVVAGSLHLSRGRRWLVWAGAAAVVVAAGACSAGFAYAAFQSRHELAAGLTTAELGVTALESGDFDEAARRFDEATRYLDAASAKLDGRWVELAAVVPVVAQHQAAVTDMSRAGADGARIVARALDEIDVEALRPHAGRIDLTALAALEGPLAEVRDALVRLRQTSEASQSPWLVNRATYELADFVVSVDEHLPSLENSLAAIRMAPRLLGADEPRTYLLLFTTPAESRGLGGFVGSYAELHVDDGQLTLGSFDRSQTLDQQVVAAGAVLHDQEEFISLYGRFGFDNEGIGRVGDAAFRNLAMTPDFPTVAEVAADLYAQTTGTAVDGVIAMDPFVVSRLLQYTGPVHLPSLGQDIRPDDALSFLLRDQYVAGVDDVTRADSLGDAAAQAFQGLIAGALPEPIELARELGPLTSERRLLVWSADPEEQALLERVHIAGEIPSLEGADGWAFTVANVGGNKIDSYLEREATYESTTDPDTGVTSGTLRIELTNTAPAEGLPRYVIGNRIGKPEGTNTMWLTIYSALGLDALTMDGEPVGVEPGTERGWQAYRLLVDIPAGTTVTLEASLSGTVARPDEIVTWTQPMATELRTVS